LHNAMALVQALPAFRSNQPIPGPVLVSFQRAAQAASDNPVIGLNLAEILVAAGQNQAAAEQARQVLALLHKSERWSAEALDTPHFPPVFDAYRVEWERAAWENPGQKEGEAKAKLDLLRWRTQTLLADLTGDSGYFYEAALARPDL